jgi:serine/threonine protein kinase
MADSSPSAADAFVGRKLGKYEVLSRLSTGGMSEIFLAFQRGLGGFRKIVVLKQILPDIKGEEEFVRMFLDEAKITGMFAHPNIAQVFDLDIAEGELFLAMEFVPGATLVEVARACRQASEPIPVGFTLMAVRDTALALHYAHNFMDPAGRALAVIHRDIAEKNIMVTFEGVTKLLDFGIAKNPAWATRTSVGMVKGTSGYMSPEQITGQKLDHRTDIFSLGVVLHECLTGMRLFPSKNPEDGMLAVLREDAPPPSRQNKSVPPEIDAIATKALQRNRDDRYGTGLELAREIERNAAGLVWMPEQAGALIQRFFHDRREQTRKLLEDNTGEHTSEIQLSELLAKAGDSFDAPSRPSAPEAQTDPGNRPRVSGSKAAKRSVSKAEISAALPVRRTVSHGDVAIPYEPKTVLEAPPPEIDVDTVPGRKRSELKGEASDVSDSLGSVATGEATARRAAFRRPLTRWILAGAAFVVTAGVGLWFWNPFPAPPAAQEDTAAAPAPPPAPPPPPTPEPAPVVKGTDAPVRLAPAPDDTEKKPTAAPSAESVAVHSPAGTKKSTKTAGAETRERHRKSTAREPEDAPAAEEGKPEPPRRHRGEASQAPGQLSLTTDPAATVILDSQPLGQTPLDHRSIPAGTHTLRLVGPDGHAYRQVVDIASGRPTVLNLSLSSLASDDH